jgi:hypothetical protein
MIWWGIIWTNAIRRESFAPLSRVFVHAERFRVRSPCLSDKKLERVKGIEPSYSAWKAAALPLSYTRNTGTHRAFAGKLEDRLRKNRGLVTP